jgi:tetratricopeptide (TPR) repeat protein
VAALGGSWFGTRAQLGYWQDNVKLFEHTIASTGQNEAARNTLGIALAQRGRLDEAAAQFQAALQVSPAHSRFRPESCNNLGRIYFDQHKWDQAEAMLLAALQADPGLVEAHMYLALTYKAQGQLDKAIVEFQRAAALEPGDMTVQGRLAGLLVKAGKAPEALAHCQALVATQAQEPGARFILAGVYVALNRPAEAMGSIREAIRLAPKTAAYPDHLARLLATCPEARLRNGAEAVELAARACALTRRENAGFLDTLSAAYAEAGRFAEAIRAAEEARAVALAHKDQQGAEEAARKLELYRAGKPYREETRAE